MFKKYDSHSVHLILFILISFTFSWLLWTPSLLSSVGVLEFSYNYEVLRFLGSFGPTFAGLLLTILVEGKEETIFLWKRCWHTYNLKYSLVALFLIPVLFALSLWFVIIIHGALPQEEGILRELKLSIPTFIFLFFFAGPLQEEIGWRGYMLDHLQLKYDALSSSIILGGIWGVWHFPLFYIAGTPYENQTFFNFSSTLIVVSILFTWLYNNTNGSVLIAMIFHASINMNYFTFWDYNTALGNILFSIMLNIVAAVIIIVFRPKTLTRKKRDDIRWFYKRPRSPQIVK